MTRSKKASLGLENVNGGRLPAKKLLIPVLFALIFMVSVLTLVTLFSENAEAAPYGVQVTVQTPKDKYLDTATTPQSGIFSIDVENTGVNLENVWLNCSFDDPSKETQGWTVNPKYYTVNNLGGGAIATIQVQVTAPENAVAHSFAQLKVETTVQEDHSQTSTDTFIARVAPKYDVRIEVKNNDNSKSVDQGGFVTYLLNITNTGNIDDTYTLSALGVPTDPEWGVSFSPSNPSVLRNKTRSDIVLTLTLPSHVFSKSYPVDVIATSQGDTSKSDSTSTSTFVNPEYQLTISVSPSPTQTGLPEENVQYVMTVQNLGNTNDLVTPGIKKLGGLTWSAFLDGGKKTINYESNVSWILTVSIPDSAKDWESGHIIFNITSDNDPTGYDERETITEVGKVYGIDVYIPDSSNTTDPSTEVYYTVEITNIGNTNDTISLTSSGEFQSSVSPNKLIDLAPGTTQTVSLKITVLEDALAGFHSNTIIATSEDTITTAQGNVTTEVNPVYEVIVTASGQSSKEGKPGGATVYYVVKVRNEGTAADTISLNLEGEKSGWAGLDNYNPDIPAKGYVLINMTVNVPAEEQIATWPIIVNGTSDNDQSVWSTALFEIRVQQTYGVELSTGKNSHTVPAGNTIYYYINAENIGSGFDNFTAVLWGPYKNWASVSPSNFGLASGTSQNITVTVIVPQTAVPGSYEIQINVTSRGNKSKVDRLITSTEVTQSYKVLVTGGNDLSGETPPGTTISYKVVVYNTGTGPDTFLIEKVGFPTSNHPSWSAISPTFVDLQPGQNFTLSVDVNVPTDTGGDTLDYLKIIIKSDKDQSIPKAQDYVWINTTITPKRSAKLTPQFDTFDRYPGDIINVKIQLLNTGTATDKLTVEDVTPVPYDTWGSIAIPNTVTLAADESTNMTYTITISSDVTRPESPIKLYLVVKSDGADDEIVEYKNITIRINQTYGVRVSTTQNTKTGDPGEEVWFRIKVTNEGNDNDTFSFSDIGDELGQWSVSDIELRADESIYAYYNLTIDSDHNTSDILVTLKVSSISNESFYDTLDITIHVDPRYRVDLGVNGSNQKKVSGGESVLFNLTIQNRGTATDTYDIEPVGATGFWATPSALYVTLDPDEITVLQISVLPPEGTEIGLYNITINVTSREDESATDEYTFYTDVQASYDLFLSTTTPSQTVPAGDPAHFTGVKIKNKGNAEDTFTFYITNMSASWSHSPLNPITVLPDDTANFNIDVNTDSASTSGIYRLFLTAVSDGDSTKEMTITLIVEVEQVFGVDLPTTVSGKNVDVGDTVSYQIEVKNTGNGEDYVELKLTGDVQPWTYLYCSLTGENGSTIHVSPPPGGSISVYLYVNPPLDYWDDFDGSISLQIEAESLDDPDPIHPANDATQPFTTSVNPDYGVDIIAGGYTSGDPDELVSFLFDVENTGTTTDSYNIRVDNVAAPPGGDSSLWIPEIYFTPSGISNLNKGQFASVTMYVEIPYPSNLALIPPGLYDITVKISSSNDPDVYDTEVFTVNVQQVFWADVQNTVTTKNVNVGQTVEYTISIKNKGNDWDNLSVTMEEPPGGIDGSVNWGKLSHSGTGQVDKSSLDDIPLAAGASTNIIFRITIPERTDPDYPAIDPDDVTLRVIVKPSDEDGTDDQVDVTANINVVYEFDFEFLAKKLKVQPGEDAEFTLKIDNMGTSSEIFTCEIFQWEEDWSAYGYSFSPSPTTIAADTIGEVTLSITTPSELDIAISRDYNITVKVHSSAGNADVFENCTIHIEPVYDVELTTTGSTTKAVNVGNTVTYQFSVRNTGNSPETFAFSLSDLDPSDTGGGDQSTWLTVYLVADPSTPITSIDLAAGESKSMILEIAVPPQGDPDFAELTKPLQVEVEATSEAEPTVKDYFTTSTTINPIYSFELSTTAPLNTKEGEPGDTVTFSLQVRNTGTTSDTYEFRVTSVDESIFTVPDPNSISNLNVDNYGTTTAQVTIVNDNKLALANTYTIEITANSKDDPGVTIEITLYVEITPKGDVELTPATQSGTEEPEKSIDYKIKISNKGNAEDIFDLVLEGTQKEWGEILDSSGDPITEITLNATGLPGSFTELTLRVTIPGTGETKADETYTITLKATSTNTEGKYDTAQASTKVENYLDLELEYSGGGEPYKDYDPNKKSPKFSFRVTNNGNQDESGIEVIVDDMDSDWDYDPKTVSATVEPGGTTTFSIEFIIPSDESEGEYPMQVYVKSSVDPSEESDHIFVTVNITKPDLTVSDVEIGDSYTEDQLKSRVDNQVTITATISNEGHSKAESIQVKLFEDNNVRGTKTISSIDPGAEREVDFRWTVVAEDIELDVEITPVEEIDEGNNNYPTIFLDLKPDLSFEGQQLNFTKSNPASGDKITITAYVYNSGGDAEDVVIKFFYGTKTIGTDTLDIDYDETGEAQYEWTVPDKPGETLTVKAEIDLSGAGGDGDETSKSIKVSAAGGVAGVFTGSGLIGMGIGLIIGAILFLIIGMALGRRGGRGPTPEGMAAGPSFAAFEKEMPEGAEKKALKAPAPFERPEGEAPPEEEERAKPREIARVRCPKCGKVTEVTSTQRPLQIPCECGTTLMLKK